MAFAIFMFDKPGHEHVRDEFRAAHYAHLERHQGRLIASGGLRDDGDTAFIGGLIIFDTDDVAEARAFVEADPFSVAGLCERVEITRWRPAFLSGQRI